MEITIMTPDRGKIRVHGQKLLEYVLEEFPSPASVTDVGIGAGYTSQVLLDFKYDVTGISLGDVNESTMRNPRYTHIKQSIFNVEMRHADIVWCSHTLEHMPNVCMFLTKCRWLLKPGGMFCIVVPSDTQQLLVDGHLTFWTPAHLIINLVHAGFNCRDAKWYTEGRDIGLIVPRLDMPQVNLNYDTGDLEYLAPYFPCPLIPRATNPWLKDNFDKEVGNEDSDNRQRRV